MAQESWKLEPEETGCQAPEGPVYCANNCGFFGSKATMNMCSKCYRDVGMAQAMSSAAKATTGKKVLTALISPLVEKPDPVIRPMGGKSGDIAAMVERNVAGPSQTLQEAALSRPVNRCFLCNKRIGLTGFKCRCGDIFCSLHRYSDKHSCSFDYKSAGRGAISKENPLVMAEKIEKI